MKYTKLETKDDDEDDVYHHHHYENDNVTLMTDTEEVSSFDDDDDDDDDDNDNNIGDVELISSSTAIIDVKTTKTTSAEEEEELQRKQQHEYEHQHQHQHHLQLYKIYNIAIPLCYLMVGLTQGIIYPLLNVYPLDLGATEAQQQTIWFLKGLPSCFKIIFGFISDNYPLMGYRRKPYMYIGWFISMISLLCLLCLSDLSLQTVTTDSDCIESSFDGVSINNNTTTTTTTSSCIKEVRVPSSLSDEEDGTGITGPPSIPLLSLIFFVWATGVWLADVIGDTLVAEKAKYETNDNRGNLQASCYLLRGLGMAIMAPISTLIYSSNNNRGPFYIILIATMLPLSLMPFIYQLNEKRVVDDDDGENENGNNESIPTIKENLLELWKTACSKAVYQPIGFIYLYVSLYVTNAAWKEFLKSVLGFTPNQLNALLFAAGLLVLIGLIVYKFCLLKWSWRTLFAMGIMLNGIFSLAQILLITNKIPFGINPFWFSLGDDGVKDFIIGTQYLPMCIMMVNLVPTGIEGMSYALFTTTWNTASAVSDSLSTILLGIWDVSKQTLIDGELNGLIKLTILTTILQIIPILFIKLMPHNVHDINRLKQQQQQEHQEQNENSSSSTIGGYIYLSIVFLSVVFAIFIGIMNIIDPGWMGES